MMVRAPTIAATTTSKCPPIVKLPMEAVPPSRSSTMATPRFAPESMPRIDGPARGLRKAVCKSKPQVPRAVPVSKAVSIWGTRPCITMMLHAGCPSISFPQRICHTSFIGMSSEPHSTFAMERSTIKTASSFNLYLSFIFLASSYLFIILKALSLLAIIEMPDFAGEDSCWPCKLKYLGEDNEVSLVLMPSII